MPLHLPTVLLRLRYNFLTPAEDRVLGHRLSEFTQRYESILSYQDREWEQDQWDQANRLLSSGIDNEDAQRYFQTQYRHMWGTRPLSLTAQKASL